MEKLRGDILNSTYICYYRQASDSYAEDLARIQIFAFTMSVSLFALSLLKKNHIPWLFGFCAALLNVLSMKFAVVNLTQYHRMLNWNLSLYKHRGELFENLASSAIHAYQSLCLVSQMTIYMLLTVFVLNLRQDAPKGTIVLFLGVLYGCIRVDSDSAHLGQRLLEGLHECK